MKPWFRQQSARISRAKAFAPPTPPQFVGTPETVEIVQAVDDPAPSETHAPMRREIPTSEVALEPETVTPAAMKQLHLIGGEKGGVGKSVMSRVLAQYCIDRGIPFQGFDSDRSHGSFSRFYEGFTQHVELEDFQSLDQLAELVLSGDEDLQVVVDLAAQSATSLRTWMEDTGVLELFNESDVVVNCWHVLDDGKDSLEMLGRLIEEFEAKARYVIVLNQGRGSRFDAFHASPQKAAALELGARIIELPKLHEGTMRQVDHSNASFWAAVHSGGGQQLGILDRQRVKMWLRKIYSELDGLNLKVGNGR